MNRTIRSSSSADVYQLDASAPATKKTAAASRGRTGMTVDWVPLAALYVADFERWRDLARRALEPNVFFEPAFARAAATHLKGREIGAVAVSAGHRLIGLMPGRIEGIAACRPVATFIAWAHPFAPFSTPLIDRAAATDVVAAMLDFLPELPGSPRLAMFPLIGETGPVARLIAGHLARGGRAPHRFAPHARAALMTGAGDTFDAISAKKLKELRRQRRRLAEEGTLIHDTVTEASGIGAAVADYLAVESKGWKGRSGSAVLLHPSIERFLAEAVAGLAAEGKARVDCLKLDGKAIASTITLFSGDRAWFWKIAYDEAFARYSPGVQLALDLTEILGRNRTIDMVDSCAVADHPMIDHLWSGRLAVADWLIPLAGAHTFMAGVAAERLRRALISPLKALRDRLGS
jgi:CelD/BcsL family acetyltransferase involved in cellulose biosynthesis